MTKDHKAVISLGSNIDGSVGIIRETISRLCEIGDQIVVSELYQTPDISGSEVMYLNAVLKGRFALGVEELQRKCKEMESSLGRRPTGVSGEVAIDIDVVIFDGVVVRPVDYGRYYFTIGMDYLKNGRVL